MSTRKRRTLKELFLDCLRDIAGGEEKPVGNIRLRNKLQWEEQRYNRIKNELVNEKLIVSGQGKGGSVALTKTDKEIPKVFISYSHHDVELKESLVKHLKPLENLGLVELWEDFEIKPGQRWGEEISHHLNESQIILLLVSIDFINSDYCNQVELQTAIEKEDQDEMEIIPIILRPCMWRHTPFSVFQTLPENQEAVTLWENEDEALADIAESLYEKAKALKNSD